MSLARTYAEVIIEKGSDTGFLNRLISYMKAKGHLSLLPSVLRVLERTPEKGEVVVTLAKKEDATKHKIGIEAAIKSTGAAGRHRTAIDPRIVGGYMVVGGGKAVDKSFRSALVSLYKNAVNN